MEATSGVALRWAARPLTATRGYPGRLTTRVTYASRREERARSWTTRRPTRQAHAREPHAALRTSTWRARRAGTSSTTSSRSSPAGTRRWWRGLIPTGELVSRHDGSPLDFRKATRIGARIDQDDPQLKLGRGYDHNYVIGIGRDPRLVPAAARGGSKSGRTMEVRTTEPGIQLYTGNWLGEETGKAGQRVYPKRSGLLPGDAALPGLAQPAGVPSTVVRPGETTVRRPCSRSASRASFGDGACARARRPAECPRARAGGGAVPRRQSSAGGAFRLVGAGRAAPVLWTRRTIPACGARRATSGEDVFRVTGVRPRNLPADDDDGADVVIAGTIGRSRLVDRLVASRGSTCPGPRALGGLGGRGRRAS